MHQQDKYPTDRHKIDIKVNGYAYSVDIPSRRTLLDLLRDQLYLTGTKKVCDMGHCGACTVYRDGLPVLSCLTLAVSCDEAEIATVEGLENCRRHSKCCSTGFYRMRCTTMRLLHAGPTHVCYGVIARQPGSNRGRDSGRHVRKPVPLWRLPGYYRSRATRRPTVENSTRAH